MDSARNLQLHLFYQLYLEEKLEVKRLGPSTQWQFMGEPEGRRSRPHILGNPEGAPHLKEIETKSQENI